MYSYLGYSKQLYVINMGTTSPQYTQRHLSAEAEGGQMLSTRQSLHEKGNVILNALPNVRIVYPNKYCIFFKY